MSKRIILNLAFFGLIGVALALWAVGNVVSLDVIDHPYAVRAEFTTSPGLSPRFEVTYLGQRIGSIREVHLAGDHVDVSMRIDHDQHPPRDVTAAVRRKSAVGEPYIDLSPVAGAAAGGPRLADGDVIPIGRTSTPLAYSALFSAVDDLLRSVDPKSLATLVHELATGLEGRAGSLRDLATGTSQIVGDLAANADLVDATISDLTTLTHTLATHTASLGSAADDVAAVTQALASSQADLDALLSRGPGFATELADVLAAGADSLGCTLDGLGALGARLDGPTVAALSRLIALSPQFAYVLRGLTAPDQGVGGGLFFNNGQGAHVPVYDTQRPPPEVPAIPACGSSAAAAAGGAGTADPPTSLAGAPPAAPGTVAGSSTPAAAGTAAAPESSSAKPASTGGSLVPLPPPWVLVPAALAAAAAATWVLRRRRRSGETAADA